MYLADEDSLYNPRRRSLYRVVGDIPVMLVDEAEAVGESEHRRLLAKANVVGG